MTQPTKKIAIIGSGISGLTLGLYLKLKGIDCDIYESAHSIQPVGAGIVLANNAMQIYYKMGIGRLLENSGNIVSDIYITDAFLNQLSHLDLSSFEKKFNSKYVAIHRAELQKILANEFGRDKLHLSKQLKSIHQGDQYKIEFEDGSCEYVDVIIGADGIHSKVRKHITSNDEIRNTQQLCWRGVVNIEKIKDFNTKTYECWGKGMRFGFSKINKEEIYWFAVIKSHLLDNKKSLVQTFKDFHPEITKMIIATDPSTIHYSQIIDLKPIKTWHKGNICLIGDAAHATTPNMGQGACQGIEDAYVLGELLIRENEPTIAFTKFNNLRRSKAHHIVNSSWKIGQVAHFDNTLLIHGRKIMMKIMPKSFKKKQLEKLFTLDTFDN